MLRIVLALAFVGLSVAGCYRVGFVNDGPVWWFLGAIVVLAAWDTFAARPVRTGILFAAAVLLALYLGGQHAPHELHDGVAGIAIGIAASALASILVSSRRRAREAT